MARPGTVHRIGGPAEPPAPFGRAMAAVLLTLVDGETPVWLDEGAPAAWVNFHCGAPSVERERAAFGVVLGTVDLMRFGAGSDDGPEEGATVILQVAGLGRGRALRLEGPGIETFARLEVEGLEAGFVAGWAANGARFPRGVDLVLCAGDLVAALPRTVRIGEG